MITQDREALLSGPCQWHAQAQASGDKSASAAHASERRFFQLTNSRHNKTQTAADDRHVIMESAQLAWQRISCRSLSRSEKKAIEGCTAGDAHHGLLNGLLVAFSAICPTQAALRMLRARPAKENL